MFFFLFDTDGLTFENDSCLINPMLLNGIHLTNCYSVFRIDLFEKW